MFWDIMIAKYIGPRPSSLNIALEGAEAAVLACLYPSEAQVLHLSPLLQQLLSVLSSVGDKKVPRRCPP